MLDVKFTEDSAKRLLFLSTIKYEKGRTFQKCSIISTALPIGGTCRPADSTRRHPHPAAAPEGGIGGERLVAVGPREEDIPTPVSRR